MKNRIYKMIFFIVSLFFCIVISNEKISAYYDSVCNYESIQTDSGDFKDCKNNVIYLDEENKDRSSFIVANREMYGENKILYKGNVNGIETFYASSFNFYAVVYDDRSLFGANADQWSTVTINNETVYDGSFDDSFFNKSSKNYLPLYNEIGTYLIKNYVGGKVTNVIRVIVIDHTEFGIEVKSATYGDDNLNDRISSTNSYDLSFEFSGGKYGIGNNILISINSCNRTIDYSDVITLKNEEFRECLVYNEVNKIKLTAYNGFGNSKTFTYEIIVKSRNVDIKLENSVSKLATTSRRVLIKATPGVGKTLDESNNLYYWSTSENDKLTYEEFMTNYNLSDKKGSYTSSRGVILRDSVGAYYLYALAKDDDSYVVVRSEKYILMESNRLNKIVYSDFILVGILALGATIPVVIYLFVRGKDTE